MTASSAVAIAKEPPVLLQGREALRVALARLRAARTAFNEAQALMAVPQSVIAQVVDQAELRTACSPARNSGTADRRSSDSGVADVVIFEMEQNAIDMIHLLRHVDRVRGPHGDFRPYGPCPPRRDSHVRRRLVTRCP